MLINCDNWGEPQASPTVTCWLGFLSRYIYRQADRCLWSGARRQGRALRAISSRRNFVGERFSTGTCSFTFVFEFVTDRTCRSLAFAFDCQHWTTVQKILGLRNWMPLISSQRSRDFLLPQGQPASKHVLLFSDFLAHRESLFDKTTLPLQLTVVQASSAANWQLSDERFFFWQTTE